MFINHRLPKYNSKMIFLGVLGISLAIFSFWKALDEFSDYLRIWHGLWHVFIGVSTFYLWQSDREDDGIGWIQVWKLKSRELISYEKMF